MSPQGSIVAIVTPMFPDESLDIEALHGLIDFHINEGTDGIVIVGTTGESPTVSCEEHCQLIETTVNEKQQAKLLEMTMEVKKLTKEIEAEGPDWWKNYNKGGEKKANKKKDSQILSLKNLFLIIIQENLKTIGIIILNIL